MSFIPQSKQLHGLSIETATLYGMPHLGAYYARDDTDSNRLRHWSVCACCGAKATNSHHEPPKGKGSNFLLIGEWGQFVLKPALIALCGSGTTGCHGMRHSGLLRIRWHWLTDENEEKWWSGYWLAHGYKPNDPKLFELGGYLFETDDEIWQVRL